jgi:hypothetical protein
MGKGREISAVTPVAVMWINLVWRTGINAVLNIKPLGEAGSIVAVRQIGDLLLPDGLRAEEGGQKKKLGEVWPKNFAWEAPRKSRFGVTWPRLLRGPR